MYGLTCALLTPGSVLSAILVSCPVSCARIKRVMRGACSRGKSETMARSGATYPAIMRSLRTQDMLCKYVNTIHLCSKCISLWENYNVQYWTYKRLLLKYSYSDFFSDFSFFLPLESCSVWLLCNCPHWSRLPVPDRWLASLSPFSEQRWPGLHLLAPASVRRGPRLSKVTNPVLAPGMNSFLTILTVSFVCIQAAPASDKVCEGKHVSSE